MNRVFQDLPSLAKFYGAFRRRTFLEIVFLTATLVLAFFTLSLLVVHANGSGLFRLLLASLFFGTAAFCLFWNIRRFRLTATLANLCRGLRSKSPALSELFSAYEFSSGGLREGVSRDMAFRVI